VTEGLRELGFATVTIDERGYRRGALNEGAVNDRMFSQGGPIPEAAVTGRES
jgi:hypothetical protein